MTEDEARTKWCPFARVPHEALDREPVYSSDNVERFTKRAVTVNRSESGTVKVGALCIASACMAWRWPGFCGLAGAPQ